MKIIYNYILFPLSIEISPRQRWLANIIIIYKSYPVSEDTDPYITTLSQDHHYLILPRQNFIQFDNLDNVLRI